MKCVFHRDLMPHAAHPTGYSTTHRLSRTAPNKPEFEFSSASESSFPIEFSSSFKFSSLFEFSSLFKFIPPIPFQHIIRIPLPV